jgi:hypothetical protein
MSHMVLMNIPKIKNLKSLERACKTLGLKLNTNQKEARYWAGNTMRCDAVISGNGCNYEMALTKEKDGSYSVHMDTYDPKLLEIVGNGCGKLSQQYQIEEHKRIARDLGKEILDCKTLPNGTIQLRIKS